MKSSHHPPQPNLRSHHPPQPNPRLLEILRCPVCGGALQVEGPVAPSVDEGALACSECAQAYPVAEGIPRMVAETLPGVREKRREAEGWVRLAERQGWYRADDEVDRALPFVCRDLGWDDPVWRGNEYSFSRLLERYLEAGMRVLEVGAAKCWAAQHLVPRGVEYVASDVLADRYIGLGRGAFYAARAGDFERVEADGEHLPFADGAFDATYCVAVLHHALDLHRMVRQMARVTRPGGVVAALNEATRPLGRSADAPAQREEKELGINEHVHSLPRYLWSFARAGLRVRRLEGADGYVGLARRPLARPLLRVPGAKLGLTLLAHGCVVYGGISLYATKRGDARPVTRRRG